MKQNDFNKVINKARKLSQDYLQYGIESDDASGEIFLRLIRTRSKFDEEKSSWNTFLHHAINYGFKDYLKSFVRYRSRFVILDPENLSTIEENIDEEYLDFKIDLERILSKFDDTSKSLFYKYFLEGYTLYELCDMFSLTWKKVRKKLSEMLKVIRKELMEG